MGLEVKAQAKTAVTPKEWVHGSGKRESRLPWYPKIEIGADTESGPSLSG